MTLLCLQVPKGKTKTWESTTSVMHKPYGSIAYAKEIKLGFAIYCSVLQHFRNFLLMTHLSMSSSRFHDTVQHGQQQGCSNEKSDDLDISGPDYGVIRGQGFGWGEFLQDLLAAQRLLDAGKVLFD